MNSFNHTYLIKKLFQALNITNFENIDDLEGTEISRDLILSPNVKEKYLDLIPKAKQVYKSSKLTSLHKNCNIKQKNHSINFLRQILKCNGFRLKPKIISLGYTKSGKKIIKRSYIVSKITSFNHIDSEKHQFNNEIQKCLNDIIEKIPNES